MTRLKNIFAVSFIAMFAVAGAHATIMTQDNIVGGTNITIDKPTSGTNAGKVVVNGPTLPTVNNATLTIKQNGGNAQTFTANASSGVEIDITKTKIGLGNVDNTSDANKPISTATQTALDAKGTLVTAKTGTAYQNIKDNIAAENNITNQYPSIATVGALLNDLANDIGGDVGGKQDTLNSGTGGNVVYSGSGDVVTNVSANGGTVTVTKGSTLGNATLTIKRNGTAVDTFTANATSDKSINITDNDHITTATTSGSGNVVTAVSADANGALTVTKGITALTQHQDISGKQNVSNMVTATTGTTYQNIKDNIASDNDIINKYPSIATVGALLNDLADDLGGDVGGKQDTLNSGTGGNFTYSGSGNVVSNVTANGGQVTITKSRVQIPSGSETATSYASIWVE